MKIEYLVDGEMYELGGDELFEQLRRDFYHDKGQYNNEDIFDMFERVYRGTSITQKNVNSKSNQPIKQTNVVRNLTSEFIEAKVDTSVPIPVVKSLRPGMDDQAKMIQEKIISDMASLPMDRMADYNERTTYINGMTPALVTWDMSLGLHDELGEKKILDYHPKQVIPQENVFKVQEMQRIHFMDSKTKDAIQREYNITLSSSGEQYPDINIVERQKNETDATGSSKDKVTQVTTFYRDKDGDIGKMSWAVNTILEDVPKYYYPRVAKCPKCENEYPQGTKKCKCGSKKLRTNIQTTITIKEDLFLPPISYPQTTKEIVRNLETGEILSVIDVTKTIVKERTVPKGTKVPIPVPKIFPISIRRNVPYNFSFRGRSDVELIQPLQESYKKIASRMEEKLLSSNFLVYVPDKLNIDISNDVVTVVKGSPQLFSQIKTFNIQAPIQSDLVALQQLYQEAQTTIGITPSFQGKYDSSAKSGKAKEIQVMQTQNVMGAPIKNKLIFYSDLFKIMFWFDLNFTQEERPYFTIDSKGDTIYKSFNKFNLLLQDKAGEWYFNTDFIFSASRTEEIPTDKQYIYQQILGFYQSGALTVEQLWQLLAGVGFPIAEKILEQANQQDKRVQLLELLKTLPPEILLEFLSAPTDELIQELDDSAREQEQAQNQPKGATQ
jgi:hypothetical protein